MKLNELILRFQKLNDEEENVNLKKFIRRIINLLEQIENNDITNEEKERIQAHISPYLDNIKTHKNLKSSLKKLRKALKEDFGFVPSNYYMTLGIGVGLALGNTLGISFGVHFKNGIVFGPMIGSAIGLVGGLIVGMYLDKKKESENRVLENL